MTDKEKQELLHRVVCYYINNPEIPYEQRKPVSEEIVPYVEDLIRKAEFTTLEECEVKLYRNLWQFKPGDIVCSLADDNYFQSVFMIPEDFDPDETFNPGPFLIDRGFGYEATEGEGICHENGMVYRYANKVERDMMKELFAIGE